MTDNVYTALAAAQIEMGAVTKGATNPAFKSKYADLSDVASVVIPALAAKGVAVFHYIKPGEGRDYMRTEFVHGASSSRIWCDVPLIVDRANMQGYKSATTYAKRIGLESLSGVAPEDDDGNDAAKAPPVVDRRPGPTDAQIAHEKAVSDALAMIESADSLDDLRDVFTGLAKGTQADPRVIKAKDAQKAKLQLPPADLGDDIPENLK